MGLSLPSYESFLNGFAVTEDARGFYSLPQDAMLRAFRNKKRLAAGISWLFHGCSLLQYLPFLKGLCSDELTVLAVKESTPAIGFELNRVQRFLGEQQGDSEESAAKDRLKEARRRGWLDEHLYLSQLVDRL